MRTIATAMTFASTITMTRAHTVTTIITMITTSTVNITAINRLLLPKP